MPDQWQKANTNRELIASRVNCYTSVIIVYEAGAGMMQCGKGDGSV